MIAVFKISNNRPSEFSLTIFLVHWKYDLAVKKRPHQTRGQNDRVTCRQLRCRKKKSRRKNDRIACPGRQMMSASKILHVYRYTGDFYILLSKGCSCMAKMDAFRSSTSRRFYSSMSSALCCVPASKRAVTNIYHHSNQGKITNEFS